MSLLTICQAAAKVAGVRAPTSIVNAEDNDAILLLACAQDEGESLARRHSWVDMVKEHTFTTTNGTRDYSLPSDYKWMVGNTAWDRSNFEQMRGPLTPQEWQKRRSSVLADTATTWKHYRIRDVSGTRKFSIDPEPDASESLVFEYMSTSWCEAADSTGQSQWLADTDEPILDEFLIRLGVKWRFLKRLGLAYDEEYEEYQREVSKAIARDGGLRTLSITHRSQPHLIGPSNVPDTGFGV